jgi:cytochrome P450
LAGRKASIAICDRFLEAAVTTIPGLVKFPLAPSEVPYDTSTPLKALIARQPVTRVELPDGSTAWLVTGYHEVREVLIDQRYSRALAASPERVGRGLEMLLAQSLMSLDPPEHSRLRRLVAGAFTQRRMDALRPRVAAIVDGLISQMLAGPRPADLVHAFSLPLPAGVICELLGVPTEDLGRFHGWSDTLFGTWERPPEEMAAAFTAIAEYMAGLIARKREHPADDLITVLIAARDDQDRLSEEELVRFCFGLLIAGHETTTNQLNMSFVTLCHHPDQLAALRADPGLIPGAVEELLRFVQMAGAGAIPPARITREEVRLGGVTIPAGEAVLPLMNVANRDPSAFGDPDRLDVSREPRSHVTFGAGAHHCLGAQLARMELQEALRGLLGRPPGLRMAVPLSEISFKEHHTIASMRELPVTWDGA